MRPYVSLVFSRMVYQRIPKSMSITVYFRWFTMLKGQRMPQKGHLEGPFLRPPISAGVFYGDPAKIPDTEPTQENSAEICQAGIGWRVPGSDGFKIEFQGNGLYFVGPCISKRVGLGML